MDIKSIVNKIPYDKEPVFAPYLFNDEDIAEYETLTNKIFPKDFKWYLQNIGTREIELQHGYYLVNMEGFLTAYKYEKISAKTFFVSAYKKYLEKIEPKSSFPFNTKYYFPFSELEGSLPINTGLGNLTVHISLNDENKGSIWGIEDFNIHDKEDYNYKAYMLAENLSSFLQNLNTLDQVKRKVKINNDGILNRCMEKYEDSLTVQPTQATTIEKLMNIYFNGAVDFHYDNARSAEFQFLRYGQAVKNMEEFVVLADQFRHSHSHQPQANDINRHEPKIIKQETSGFLSSYFEITVKSQLYSKHDFTEIYLVYKNNTSNYSLVRRLESKVKNLKINELGTFGYDSSYWKSVKRSMPVWSELSLIITLQVQEDKFSNEIIEKIKKVVNDKELKSKIEKIVLKYYQEKHFPEYELFDDYEREANKKNYPRLKSANEIWKLFRDSKYNSINFFENGDFEIYFEFLPDEEHGITISSRKDKLNIG